MTADPSRWSAKRAVEWGLALIVIASLAWTAVQFFQKHYLPQPFVFDTNDTFMDWFNTAYWANNPGAFDVWRTIYPPLSFVFLKATTLSSCYLESPFYGRDCDWLARTTIYFSYGLVALLAFVSFRRIDRTTAIPRGLAFALGMPLLYTLERGNLILPCVVFFIIAYGDLVKSPHWKWMAMAVTINFKPYLLIPVLPLAIKRDWRSLEMAGFATIAVYLLTLATLGDGTLGQMAANTRDWVTFQSGQIWNEIYYSTSYAPLTLIDANRFPIRSYMSSETFESITATVPVLIRVSQLLTLAVLMGGWLQPAALSFRRLSLVAMAGYFATQSPGGYSIAFLTFLLFLERADRTGPMIALVCGYLLAITADWPLATITNVSTTSWLGGQTVLVNFSLAIGQLVRPGLVIVLLWSLAVDSLILIVAAHRSHVPTLGLGKSRFALASLKPQGA